MIARGNKHTVKKLLLFSLRSLKKIEAYEITTLSFRLSPLTTSEPMGGRSNF
jgi:hypothetical protein